MKIRIYSNHIRQIHTCFLVLIVLLLVALVGSCSKKSEKVYHIGILSGFDFFYPIVDGFKDKMTRLGYIEGKNIAYEVEKSNVDVNKYRDICKKFVADKVDLILSFPTEASMEAKTIAQGAGIPLVFVNAFTENTNLINSVREPGGNITGVRWAGPDMALQRLEIMCELVPKAKHFFIPYIKNYPIVKSQVEALHKVSKTAGLVVTDIPANNATELDSVLKKQTEMAGKPDAIITIAEPLCVTPELHMILAKFAEKYKIPLGGVYMPIPNYESLFGLTPQSIPQGNQAAFLADKILKGTPAGTIPVVSAECFLTINCKTAAKIGLAIDKGLLTRANEVIR